MPANPNNYHELLAKALNDLSFDKEPISLYEPISYTLSLGGKRIRPILCLMSTALFNGKAEDAVQAAIALEIFHNFTLVHDDIMDEAPVRRGQPTVHEKWNRDTAILSGDVMFVKAYEHLIQSNKEKLPQLLKLFNATAIKVCEGQQMDMDFEQEKDVNMNAYLNMIELKTAELLACSLKMGAIIAGAKEKEADLIYQYGKNIGIAFQIQDDYLDAYGDKEKFGKSPGGDIVNNKKTYLMISAFDRASRKQNEALKEIREGRIEAKEKIHRTLEIFDKLGIEQLTLKAVDSYYEKAMKAMNEIQVEEEKKQPLIELTDNLMQRST